MASRRPLPGAFGPARPRRRRIPHYLWEYLDNATGDEARGCGRSGAECGDAHALGLLADIEPVLDTPFLGRSLAAPSESPPSACPALSGRMPNASCRALAAREGIPYCLSTVAAVPPEEIAGEFGDMGWFQLYAPTDPGLRRDVLARAKDAGFHTLILTIDVPVLSRREREMRVGIENPMPLTPSVLLQSAVCPAWAMGMLGRPMPRPRLFDKYARHADEARGRQAHRAVGPLRTRLGLSRGAQRANGTAPSWSRASSIPPPCRA